MIDISNVRLEMTETYLFISPADKDEITWLLLQAGAKKEDFRIYPRHMIMQNKVPVIRNLSNADREKELRDMYGERATTLMSIASVLISKYNKEDLFNVLKPIIIDLERDADYKKYYWKENEKYQQDEWPVE